MEEFLLKLQHILSSFLGEPRHNVTSNGQLEFNCPRCRDNYGMKEDGKFNLSVNVISQKFQCWKCSQTDDEMHGSVMKLIKLFGNSEILNEYVNSINEFKTSKLYQLNFSKEDFNISATHFVPDVLKLPNITHRFNPNKYNPKNALNYLFQRGIDWDIINEFKIGYTDFDIKQKELSTRIIIPSYNEFDELNYWTGRDFSNYKGKQKYYNPQVERKNIIFNENKVQWDADIILCEGPFDHIVTPNSIPLLGKSLHTDFKIYNSLMKYANANVIIFLDGDAFDDVKKIYSLLNHGRLYNKIKYVPVNNDLDPSEIFQKYGRKGIIDHIRNAQKISEVYL